MTGKPSPVLAELAEAMQAISIAARAFVEAIDPVCRQQRQRNRLNAEIKADLDYGRG